MTVLSFIIFLLPFAGIFGIIAVILLIILSIIEGFTLTWILMLIRKNNPAHWFWRPFAWSTVTIWLSGFAAVLNALLITKFYKADHILYAVLFPVLACLPFLIAALILISLSIVIWFRSHENNRRKIPHIIAYTISGKSVIIIGNIFMMTSQFLLTFAITVIITCSVGSLNIGMIVTCISISLVLIIASIGMWYAGDRIKSLSHYPVTGK